MVDSSTKDSGVDSGGKDPKKVEDAKGTPAFSFQGASIADNSLSDTGSTTNTPFSFSFGVAANNGSTSAGDSWSIPKVELGLGGGIAGAKDTPVVTGASKDTTSTIVAGQDEEIAVDVSILSQ